jgi:hemerythrin-like metal-binding protein
VTKIQWKKDYETGIDRIDFQHQSLVNILNDIISIPNLEDSLRNRVLELNLEELLKYTVYHFEIEEQVMKESNFPNFDEHKKEHEALKLKATNFVDRFNNGERELENPIFEFLKTWLINHIGKSDMDYVPYVLKMQTAV